MNATKTSIDLQSHAAEALAALLNQVSGIRLKEIQNAPAHADGESKFLAQIDVLGHHSMLACTVHSSGNPDHLRIALRGALNGATVLPGDATPILIAPYLSPESQVLCKQARIAYLDLVGNARLSVGEIFIGTRAIPGNAAEQVLAALPKPVVRVDDDPAMASRKWNRRQRFEENALTA